MAKNKSKKKAAAVQPMGPERFLREKARSLPVGDCYMNYDKEMGLSTVLVSRRRPSGNMAVAVYLVDTFCLGVKDISLMVNVTPQEYDEILTGYIERFDMVPVSYPEAHNLIYGAIEWAGEADIMPCKEWALGKYLLEEDTDDIPYVEYEYGDKGKYHLIVTARKEDAYLIPQLQKRLGDNFHCTIGIDDISEPDDEDDWEEDNDLPHEEYSYTHPEYPSALEVKHQFIADALLAPDPANVAGLPLDVRDRIMALPPDEAAEDIARVILYTIGQTWESIAEGDDEVPDSSIAQGVVLLTAIDSRKGLPALLELARQSSDFIDAHLGDLCLTEFPEAICKAAGSDFSPVMELLQQPGLESTSRHDVAASLGFLYFNEPERRPEAIDAFSRLLDFITPRLERAEACDAEYAGLLIATITELGITSLLPKIKTVMDTGFVNRTICGSYDNIEANIADGDRKYLWDIYGPKSLDEIYGEMKRMWGNGREATLR
ncbi:MAG: DUF1186 domain-containing protein [Pseudoflavonifractor sp.]|nr:DUF1186 domain-containing protein [Alloprevotella sp.]MCM1115981.1 DUF1186 domain-containing protein [Pseudoflavonifractor sp.]